MHELSPFHLPRANANPFMNFCNLKKGYSREE